MAEAKSLAALNEWAQLVKEQERDSQESFVHLNALLLRLTESEISSLVSIFAVGPPNEKYAAAALLLSLMRGQDKRLKADLLSRIASAAQSLATSEYPHTRLGARAYAVLDLADPAAAEEFILSLDPTEYVGEELVHYFVALELRSTQAKVDRLRDLEQRGGELARRATQSLGNRGVLSASQLRELAERFRVEPIAEHLRKIFHVYALLNWEAIAARD